MKITKLRATAVNIPFTAPYQFSYGSMGSVTKTIVEVETEDGVVGLGELADGDRSEVHYFEDPIALARCHRRFLDEGSFPAGVPGATYGGQFRKA